MTENPLITQARTWIGTPFHHQGRVKGVGCDCLGMLIGVADELKLVGNGVLIASLDNVNYSLSPNTTELIAKMAEYLQEVRDIEVGDIALLKMEGNPQHLGIITDYVHGGFGILHAIYGNGVVEHALTTSWENRIYKLYRPSSSLALPKNKV